MLVQTREQVSAGNAECEYGIGRETLQLCSLLGRFTRTFTRTHREATSILTVTWFT